MTSREPRFPRIGRTPALAGPALGMALTWAGAALALPQTPSIAGTNGPGPGATFNTSGSSLTVNQSNSRVVVNWGSFNIASGETVTFAQPATSSIAFNVVPAGVPTTIAGSLNANGGVWLFSPAGIVFGAGAAVNTGSFLASTGVFDSTTQTEALGVATTSIDIAPQLTPGAAAISVDSLASINAHAGFVLLHAPTITQSGTVGATDAVVYNADEDLHVNISAGAQGVTLVDDFSTPGTPSASHIDHSGTTTAGSWFEVDAAEDVTTHPGFGGIINLDGHVTASGMKADPSNPTSSGNGFSVILDGDAAGNTGKGVLQVTTIDASGGTITAASGIAGTAGTLKTGLWTNNGGAVLLNGGGGGIAGIGGPTGVLIDHPLTSAGSGPVEIEGFNVAINANLTAPQTLTLIAGQLTVAPNVTVQAGSSMSVTTLSNVSADPTSTVLVGPSLAAPNGILTIKAGVDVGRRNSSNIDQSFAGQGGDLSLGRVAAGSMSVSAASANGVGGAINAAGPITGAGVVSLYAAGPVTLGGPIVSSGSVFVGGSAVSFGPNGAISAGSSGPPPAGDTISTHLGAANVTLQTTASAANILSAPPGAGDILVGAPVTWSNPNPFTLDAYHAIAIGAGVVVPGGGQVVLKTNDGGAGGDYSFVPGGSLAFTGTPNSGQALTINGQAYTLLYTQADLLGINNNLGGFYAVATPIDFETASGVTAFGAAPIANLVSHPFTGAFTGLGNAISHLIIADAEPVAQLLPSGYATTGQVGLFGTVGVGGVVRDVTLANASVSGLDGMQVGALVGGLQGTVIDASASGAVNVGSGVGTSQGFAYAAAGGLVGVDFGTIRNSQSSARVSGGDALAGGLAGAALAGAGIAGSSASGAVSVGDFAGGQETPAAGGLLGQIYGYQFGGVNPIPVVVSGSTATGAVSGGAGSTVAGFVGAVTEGQISTSFATGSVSQALPGQNAQADVAAGFVGVLATGGAITGSYASGAVTTVGGTTAQQSTVAGGFIGDLQQGGTVSNAYSLSPVTTTGSAFAITGGFAGVIQTGGSADRVYATGPVSGSGAAAGLVGLLGNGAAANTSGALSNSYWDTATTGQTTGYNLSGTGAATNVVGVGGSGPSPYAASTYASFDLANTWFMIDGETRPILRSEYSTTITNAHQLQLMSLNLGAAYMLAGDMDAGETANAAGVWNQANQFVPIGPLSTPFTGQFDGRGHTISNLTITGAPGTAQTLAFGFPTMGAVGLFGVEGAGSLIENVNLANAHVTGGNGMEAGALVGIANAPVINASSSGVITTGGGISVMISGTPTNVFATAGGLIGASVGSTIDSSSSATVTGADAFLGGLLGAAGPGASIAGAHATGAVTSGDAVLGVQTSAAGGLIGIVNGAPFGGGAPIRVTVTRSYASGNVAGGAGSLVGGFTGALTQGQISASYATGSTTQTVGAPTGLADIGGGFIGLMDTGGAITGSYSSGAVNTVGGSSSSYTFGGGFVGYMQQGATVSDAYSLGAVTSTGSSFSYQGGFAGLIGLTAVVDHVYATGAVSGAGASGGLVGNLIGGIPANTGFLSNSYWDEGTTLQTSAVGTGTGAATNVVGIGGSTGLSPYAPATYANFDLASTWFVIGGETRPILRAEYSTRITDAHQLELMSLNLGANYTLAGDIDASETGLSGATSPGIWNPLNGFVPVGAAVATPFTGQLDGRGRSISNLTIVDTTGVPQTAPSGSPTNGAVGLFGFATGTIKGVNLSNAVVTGGDGMAVGALVGNLESGLVSASSSSGVVTTGSGVNSGLGFLIARAGGLVGDSGAFNASGVITDSSSSATVTGVNAYVGGAVGQARAGSQIIDSFATGAVNVGDRPAGNPPADPIAGGLIGLAGGSQATPVTITGSYATGPVTGGALSLVGGFGGYLNGVDVRASYATGAVTQTSGQAGGFVASSNSGLISRSFATGAVSTGGAGSAAGGFVGIAQIGSIQDSYATGPVSLTGGAGDVGGFAGGVELGASVNRVYATGRVTGTGSVGGLIGDLGSNPTGSLSNSYWDVAATGQAAAVGTGPGTATNVVGMGVATGVDPFNPATYAGWDFANTWSTPSAGVYPQLYGVSHVLRVSTDNVALVYGSFPIYTAHVTGLQSGDDLSVVDFNFAVIGAGTASSGFYDAGAYGVSAGASATGGNLVQNGGFETGTFADWAMSGNLGATFVSNAPNAPHSGLYAAQLGAVGSDDILSQTLTTTPGRTYDLTFWHIYSPSAGPPGDFSIRWNGTPVYGPIASTNPPSPQTWTQYSIHVVGTGSDTLSIVSRNDPAYQGLDDVALLSSLSPSAYRVISPNGTLNVAPRPLTLAAVTDSRTYDGGVLSNAAPLASGMLAGDSVLNLSQSFDSRNAGARTLSVNGGYVISDGNSGRNYTVTTITAPGMIDPRVLDASLTGTVDRNFDGTTTATLAPANYLLSGNILAGDTVALNDPTTGFYDNSNPGVRKTVFVNGLALTGPDAGNYTVNPTASAPIGSITDRQPPPIYANILIDQTALDLGSTQIAGGQTGGAGEQTGGAGASVVSVFPVAGGPEDFRSNGANSPITGAGNRDLWTGADQTVPVCPPDSRTPSCVENKGRKP